MRHEDRGRDGLLIGRENKDGAGRVGHQWISNVATNSRALVRDSEPHLLVFIPAITTPIMKVG